MPKRPAKLERIAAAITLSEGEAPEWIQLLPAGRFALADGREQAFDLTNPEFVITASMTGRDLPIDYDHALDRSDVARKPAAGWITAMEVREGSIWGRVSWTESGAKAIASREYRFLSPVFFHDTKGVVASIQRAALTNNPALPMLKALASQEAPMDTILKRLAKLFGISDDSDEEAVIAAAQQSVTLATGHTSLLEAICSAGGDEVKVDDGPEKIVAAIQAGATPDPAKFVPIAQHQAVCSELTALKSDGAKAEAERTVGKAIQDGKLVPAQRDWALAFCSSNPTGFDEFVKNQPEIVPPGEREVVTGDPASGEGALGDAGLAVCSSLGIDPEDYKKTQAAQRA